ncbi:MAG: Ig-like domain repeat protein [Tahibacter sp.]
MNRKGLSSALAQRRMVTGIFFGALCAGPASAGPYAYVPVASSYTVSVIDTATNLVVANVFAPTGPIGVAVSPDGMRVYVASQNAHSIEAIDALTNTVTATLPLASDPFGVAVSPDGTRAYVALSGNDTVAVIDTASFSVIGTIAVGSSPRGLTVTPNGAKVYVSNQSGWSVSVIDAATNTVVSTLPAGGVPTGVAVSPDGTRVYAATQFGNGLTIINTATDTLLPAVPMGQARGVAVAPNGRVYVTHDDQVSVLDPLTQTIIATLDVGDTPYGISISTDGTRAYVANVHSAFVSVIDTASNSVIASVPTVDGGFSLGVFVAPPIVPRAPSLLGATAQDRAIQLTFAAPTADGGSPIAGFKATCGAFTSSGPASPLTVAGLNNGTSYPCSVQAINGVGTGPASSVLSVTPGIAPAFLGGAPPSGTFGTPYAIQLTASGSPTPVFSLASGSLPAGLSLAGDGTLSGTPTSALSYNGSIAAANGVGVGAGTSALQSFSISIAKAGSVTTLSGPSSSTSGDAVQLHAVVDAPSPTGSVDFKDGANAISACSAVPLVLAQASCSASSLSIGAHAIRAVYSGSANHLASTSGAISHTVNPILHQVTTSVGAGGSVLPSEMQSVAQGSILDFSVTPDSGNRIVAVSGCGGNLLGNMYSTAPITASCAVIASFNHNPVANPGSLSLIEDQTASGVLSASDDGALSYSIVAQGSKGSVVVTNASSGAYTYTPHPNANGSDTFGFKVNDGGADSNVASVTVDIAPVNDAPTFSATPTAFSHPAQSTGNRTVAGWATGFDAGAANEASQSVADYLIGNVIDPDHVVTALDVSNAGALSYSLSGASGSATFAIRVQDSGGVANGGVDVSTVHNLTITVLPGADLQLSKTNSESVLVLHRDTLYTVQLRNAGPSAVASVLVVDDLPTGLDHALWTCLSLPNGLCPHAGGSGSIHETTAALPNGALLEYALIAMVSAAPTGFVSNTASANSLDSGVTEIGTPGNNSATDTDPVLDDGLFIDGFENASEAFLHLPTLH